MEQRGSVIDAQVELKEQILQEYKRLTGSEAYQYWYENYAIINGKRPPKLWEKDLQLFEKYEQALREGKNLIISKARNKGERLGRFIIAGTMAETEDKMDQLRKLFYESQDFKFIEPEKKPNPILYSTYPSKLENWNTIYDCKKEDKDK